VLREEVIKEASAWKEVLLLDFDLISYWDVAKEFTTKVKINKHNPTGLTFSLQQLPQNEGE
jgi:hypothetical protein